MIFNPDGKEKLQITDTEVLKRYLHAGKGKVTLVAPSMKAHKYLFSSPRNALDFEEGTIFVYVIHDQHPMYVGIYDLDGTFRLTRGSRFNADTEAARGAAYIARMASSQELMDRTQMKIYHDGKCCKCGRKLDSDSSLESGIGKKCLKKYNEMLQRIQWDGN